MRWLLKKQRFHTPVLVAELDFQMVYLLAMAHETKMSRLNHASVDRADTHFVHLGPAHLEERVFVHVTLAPTFKAHWFEPGMALRYQASLLPQFALKNLCGWKFGGQAWIALTGYCMPAQHL